jgi:hypothetical protein
MLGIGTVLSKIALSLLMQLVTENFIKQIIVHTLEVLAKKTEAEWDNQLVANVKEAWKA